MLYIVRHAWAEVRDEAAWPDDDLRPLTGAGRKRMRKMARRLVKRGFAPSVVATSPLVRCRQTADVLADALPDGAEIVPLAALAPGSDLGSLVAWSAGRTDREIAWVGHAPDVGRLAAQLVGDGQAGIDLAKGAIAAIEFDPAVAERAGVLKWLVTAGILGA